MTSSKIQETLHRMSVLHPRIIDLSLSRVRRLLKALGSPERSLRTIHIAGTNGKGSTLAFLKAFFEEEGYSVNAYISPHLLHFNERIILQGQPVSDDVLMDALSECEKANDGRPITFFEITTAAAFLLFSRNRADITLCETGLGGRFDATNVLKSPDASVITPIGVDHIQYLGSDLASIATEKAGIIKKGGVAISSRQFQCVDQAIEKVASENKAQLYRYGRDWSIRVMKDGFLFRSEKWKDWKIEHPALMGRHQYINAGTAMACLERLKGFTFRHESLQRAVRRVVWPGRMQRLEGGNLSAMLPKKWELWLDGAHNSSAAQALGEILHGWVNQPMYLLLGMMKGKDPYQFLRHMAPFTRKAYVMRIPDVPSSLSTEDLLAGAAQTGIVASSCAGIEDGLKNAIAQGDSENHCRVLIGGSLYLAAAVIRQEKGESPR